MLNPLSAWTQLVAAPACVPGCARRVKAGPHKLLTTVSRAAVPSVQQESLHWCQNRTPAFQGCGARELNPCIFLFQVLFKLLLGSAKFGEAALFLSVLAVFNVLFVTCIPVILYFTKVEYWSSFDIIPWGNLCGFSILLLSE